MNVEILMPNVNPKSFIDDYLQKIGIEYPQSYMNVTRCHLEEPSRYVNIDEATKRLKMAIDGKQKVGIIQDCDVDGLCSAVIAYQFLKSNGVEPIVFFHSGKQHGINDLMTEILNANLDLLIVPDASGKPEECKTLRDNGCDVIIADHHEYNFGSNPFAIIVNCKQQETTNQKASGALVMQKIVDRFYERYDGKKKNDGSDLVGLSILSDSMSVLEIENRAYLNIMMRG